ncbi:translation initiation factor IF-2-like [Panicum virgatum]|uniref:translation initiation factor IF-2-like n=1 Tax=Panicum virgatum TaxID=38727 RepID=UPI0019D51C8C|nr:translation initiation factor IF-2-like [Panicum virgatum]
MPPSPAQGGGRARPAHGRARQRRLAGPHPRLVPASVAASWPRGSPGASPASLVGARFPRLAGPRPPPPAWPRLLAARCGGGGGWPARRPAHGRARPRRRLAAACRPAAARASRGSPARVRPHQRGCASWPRAAAAAAGRLAGPHTGAPAPAGAWPRLAGPQPRALPAARRPASAPTSVAARCGNGGWPARARPHRRLARLAAPACA